MNSLRGLWITLICYNCKRTLCAGISEDSIKALVWGNKCVTQEDG